MKTKDFSVAMSVYGKDNPEHFKIAVKSVLSGTVKPSEVVLVVDGPVPSELDEIIKEYEQDPIFKIVRLEKNVGHGGARRAAVENCSFELIAQMDSDDICLPHRFERQLKIFEENLVLDVLSGDITEFVGDEKNIIGRRSLPIFHEEIEEYMKTRCPFNNVAVMFKKSAVLEAGNYIDWYCNEDYYLWIRMYLNECRFANTGDVLVNVRAGEDMYGRRGGIKYFKSEAKIQKLLLKNKIIGFGTFTLNVLKRFIVQILAPNFLRAWIFKHFARTK